MGAIPHKDIIIHIDHEIKAKERPRKRISGKFYTPKSTILAEQEIGFLACAAMGKSGMSIIKGPVSIQINFSFSTKDDTLWSWPCPCKKDIDNMIKTVLDGLNGVAYLDDRQVCELVATKSWNNKAGVEITVSEINE
jgi:Holliday junction resolvase RusA-like endonuclease